MADHPAKALALDTAKIEKHARTDPQIIEALALRIQRRAIEGKHTLVLAKPTKGGQP